MQVRLNHPDGYVWKIVRENEIVDLPEKVGLANGFEEIKTEKVKPKKVKHFHFKKK